MVCLQGQSRFMTVNSLSGYNAYTICTASDARRSERHAQHEKFGKRLLRINRLSEFAAKLRLAVGANRVTVRDVVYSDAKVVKGYSDLPEKFVEINGRGELKDNTLEYLAENWIDFLIEITEAASAFTKPCTYYHERERRLLFTMPTDVTTWTAVREDHLAEHIEVLV